MRGPSDVGVIRGRLETEVNFSSIYIYFILIESGEASKMNMAAAIDPAEKTNAAIAAAMAATIDAEMIDENLFDGEDLDELDEDLEQLTL